MDRMYKLAYLIILFATFAFGSGVRVDTINSVTDTTVFKKPVKSSSFKGPLSGTADSAKGSYHSRVSDSAFKAHLADTSRAARYSDTLRGKILDSIKFYAEKVNRLYFGLAKGDTIYSKLDTTHVSHVDTLQINQEFMFPNRWDDVGDIKLDQIRQTGTAGVPDWSATGLGFNKNQFGIGDSAQGSTELFHKFVEGDSTEFHLHWYKNSNEAGATFVNWSLRYWIFNSNDSVTYGGTLTHQDTIAAGTKLMTHHVTSLGTVPTPLTKIGAKIVVMVKRIAASPTTNPASDPFGSTVGCHKKINSIGSHSIYTK